MKTGLSSFAIHINAKPPPPMPENAGAATPNFCAAVTAASIALPPIFKVLTPALDAVGLAATTIAGLS
jgi:hypothetical protein